jgi:serine/threonine-protein kinase RsbW
VAGAGYRVTVQSMAGTNLDAAVVITLVVSATNDHISYARLQTVAVAGKIGFDFDAIEDVRIAVSDLCGTIIACAAPDSELRLDIRADSTGLTVSGQVPRADGADLEPDELSEQVLAVVTDSYEYTVADDVVSFRMTRATRSGIA